MARPTPGRMSYSPWSVDIFDVDSEIDRLIRAQGWVGFGIYFALCQRAYGTGGYFYKWGYADADMIARRLPGSVGPETVIQTVNLCFKLGLFDRGSFDRDGVLTSRGIQRRYAAAMLKDPCKIANRDYWLLAENGNADSAVSQTQKNREASGLISYTQNAEISTENGISGQKRGNAAPPKPPKEDKKEKERKENKKEERAPAGLPPTSELLSGGELGGEGWMRAMKDAGMEATGRARKLLSQLAARYGDAETCTCIRIAAAQGRPGPDYVCGIARRRAEEGQTGKPYPPPANTRPARHLAKHDYGQRTYDPGELDALFYDIMSDGEAEGTGKKEGLT